MDVYGVASVTAGHSGNEESERQKERESERESNISNIVFIGMRGCCF